MAPVAVWIAPYKEGSLRTGRGSLRTAHWLPRPEWLCHRLAAAGLEVKADKGSSKRRHWESLHEVRLAGLMLFDVDASCCYERGPLTPWGPEASALRVYFRWPTDAFSLKVVEFWKCLEDVGLTLCLRKVSGRRRPEPLAFRYVHPLSLGMWGDNDEMPAPLLGRDGAQQRAHDLLVSKRIRVGFKECYILLYPEQIVKLIERNHWGELLFSIRWLRKGTQLHPTFPPRGQRVWKADGKPSARDEETFAGAPVRKTEDLWFTWVQALRRWAPAIIDNHAGDETFLESMVSALDSWQKRRRGLATFQSGTFQSRSLPAEQILACIRSAWFVRGGMDRLQDMLKLLLPVLLPDVDADSVANMDLPSAAAVRYHELTFDAALMMWRSKHIARMGAAVRWGGGVRQ